MNTIKEKNYKTIRDAVVDGTGWFGMEWPIWYLLIQLLQTSQDWLSDIWMNSYCAYTKIWPHNNWL